MKKLVVSTAQVARNKVFLGARINISTSGPLIRDEILYKAPGKLVGENPNLSQIVGNVSFPPINVIARPP